MEYSKKVIKSSSTMLILCFAVYAILSMSKTAFTSSMSAMITDNLFTRSQAGVISACFYFLYGAAQLFGAKYIDKKSPMLLISIALIGAFLASIGMAVANKFIPMFIIWSLCGLLQFAAWPCIVKIIAEYLWVEHRHKAMTIIAFAYCVGNLFNYFCSAIILKYSHWRMIFVTETIIILIMILFWVTKGVRASKVLTDVNIAETKYNADSHRNNHAPDISYTKLLAVSGILILLIPGFIRTALDLGIKSWVPTIMVQSYSEISPSFATVLTTVLLVINLSGVFIANYIYPKYFKNVITALTVCFVLCIPFTLAMAFIIGKVHYAIVIAILVIITTMMYCGNQLLNVVVPSFFNKYNRSGSVAGILNAAASFGAVASNFGYGFLADKFGWTGTILSWTIMAVISMISTAICIPIWKKFTQK